MVSAKKLLPSEMMAIVPQASQAFTLDPALASRLEGPVTVPTPPVGEGGALERREVAVNVGVALCFLFVAAVVWFAVGQFAAHFSRDGRLAGRRAEARRIAIGGGDRVARGERRRR